MRSYNLIALKPYAPRLKAKQLAPNPDLIQQTLIIDGTERPVERNTQPLGARGVL
jgi:hypothetical protein